MTSAPEIKPKFLPSRHELGIVAVGFSGGQPKPGTEAAPHALIEAGLINQLKTDLSFNVTFDNKVHTYSDLMPPPAASTSSSSPSSDPPHRGMKRPRAVSAATRALQRQTHTHASAGRLVLTLGGDHSIAIGSIAGVAQATRERLGPDRTLAVIWVDAHADINTPETSDSGNIHGMPLSFLTGLAQASATSSSSTNGNGALAHGAAPTNAAKDEEEEEPFAWLTPDMQIPLSKLVYIGLRDIDAGEKRLLRQHSVRAFSMHDIDRHGIGRVMDMALGHIGADSPIHLSFDVDALDPQWAPSTGTPVRGGLTLREGDFIAECVAATGNLVALDLVEVNPTLEEGGAAETVRAGCSIVRCALGDTLL